MSDAIAKDIQKLRAEVDALLSLLPAVQAMLVRPVLYRLLSILEKLSGGLCDSERF